MMKNRLVVFLCIGIFGALGIYLTFISGNDYKYDGMAFAYKVEVNESYDSNGSVYYPVFYFKINEKEYACKSKIGSSFVPNNRNNKVYYDLSNPEKCITEYEKKNDKIFGIICLVVSVLILILKIKNPVIGTDNVEDEPTALENLQEFDENSQRVEIILDNVQLIIKRVIIGIIIIIISAFILIDTMLFKQTIKSKDYIDVIATLVNKKEDSRSNVFEDYIYSFEDKSGNTQEIIISLSKNDDVKQQIKIKYNENAPQDYYEEGATLDKAGIIWYVIKIIAVILLVVLFFNKNLLNKVNIFIR